MNCHSIRRKLPVAGSVGKGSKKIVLFLAALICTVCMTGFTAKAASVEGNIRRHSRSIAVQTRETITSTKDQIKAGSIRKKAGNQTTENPCKKRSQKKAGTKETEKTAGAVSSAYIL